MEPAPPPGPGVEPGTVNSSSAVLGGLQGCYRYSPICLGRGGSRRVSSPQNSDVKSYYCPDRSLPGGRKRPCAQVSCSVQCLLWGCLGGEAAPQSSRQDAGRGARRPGELCQECVPCSRSRAGHRCRRRLRARRLAQPVFRCGHRAHATVNTQ